MISELLLAFDALKTAMSSTAALRVPDPALPFILETDASNVALGAVIRQGTQGDSYPVAFFSIWLSNPEKLSSSDEPGFFAIVKACVFFNVFQFGPPFTLKTDHKALAALFTSKPETSTRIAKWIMRHQDFTFSIGYRKGPENIFADALSRITWPVLPREFNALNIFLILMLSLNWNLKML